jgi:hypothetical protein
VNHRTRVRVAALVFGAVALLGAAPALSAPGQDDDGGGRIAVNGTQRAGVREPNAGIQSNGTKLTGVRDPNASSRLGP